MAAMKGLAIKRKKRGMTQSVLAMQLGVTLITVSRWETGRQNPDISTLQRLSQIFNCTVDELLAPSPPRTAEENSEKSPVVRK